MDFTQILTTLWGKISKPLPNILVGLVFVFLAPKSIQWFGFVFISIGLASAVESIFPKFVLWRKKYDLKKCISRLSQDEIAILQTVRKNEGFTINTGNPQLQQIQDAFWKFEGLGLVYSIRSMNHYEEPVFTFLLHGETERALKEIVKNELVRGN
jgi:hypothetical protein